MKKKGKGQHTYDGQKLLKLDIDIQCEKYHGFVPFEIERFK